MNDKIKELEDKILSIIEKLDIQYFDISKDATVFHAKLNFPKELGEVKLILSNYQDESVTNLYLNGKKQFVDEEFKLKIRETILNKQDNHNANLQEKSLQDILNALESKD